MFPAFHSTAYDDRFAQEANSGSKAFTSRLIDTTSPLRSSRVSFQILQRNERLWALATK